MTAPRLPRLDDIRQKFEAATKDTCPGCGAPVIATEVLCGHSGCDPQVVVRTDRRFDPQVAPEDIAFLLALVEKSQALVEALDRCQEVIDSGSICLQTGGYRVADPCSRKLTRRCTRSGRFTAGMGTPWMTSFAA